MCADRVLGFAQGAYAEVVAANPASLLPIPDRLSYDQASVVFLYVAPIKSYTCADAWA